MYQGKRRIMNPERHEEYRSQAISFRGGAIFNAFIDLEDIINKSVFAKTYMNHSQSWFSQKLNECPVGGAKKEFSASEAETIAESFKDLAKRMNCLAEEILALSPISSVCARRGRRIYLSYIYTPVIYRTHGNMKAFLVNLIVIVVGK